ncbi:MAG TPA: hypothetical protein VGF28_07095 [Thermoanaerobaculia bacterium]
MIYRKRGAVARWEHGTLIRVTESGVAIEEGDLFTCHPEGGEEALAVPPPPKPDIEAERVIVSRGIAHHQSGDRAWSEETRRFHAALVHGRLRALVDDEADVGPVAEALRRAGAEREAPSRLRLAPGVTAALVPSLAGIAPPNVRLLQTAGGVDGYGNEIVEAEGEWPNWYRPSYRVRPVRMPHNLRLECDVTEIDERRPRAIALLAPVEGLTLRVLVEEGARVYPCTVRVTHIDAVSNERRWYPYGAGSFGAEMML